MNNPKQLTFPWNKSYKSSFNNFYVDPANAQLISSIQTDFSSENLYIFGVKNSGKTYLLQSLCNLYSNKNKSVLFLPLKEVMTYGTEMGASRRGW